ncbi:MAG: hypothetical protein DRJ41_03690 [Thermoprotei archaeon]|nr:MAG: hypothetical protein DRJ41_03690 [Thermoprotei archaeon]
MTLDKNLLFNILLALLMFITVPSLAALNEKRLDVYLGLFSLEYSILLALLRPRRRCKDFIAPILLLLFMLIVILRIIEMLMG